MISAKTRKNSCTSSWGFFSENAKRCASTRRPRQEPQPAVSAAAGRRWGFCFSQSRQRVLIPWRHFSGPFLRLFVSPLYCRHGVGIRSASGFALRPEVRALPHRKGNRLGREGVTAGQERIAGRVPKNNSRVRARGAKRLPDHGRGRRHRSLPQHGHGNRFGRKFQPKHGEASFLQVPGSQRSLDACDQDDHEK